MSSTLSHMKMYHVLQSCAHNWKMCLRKSRNNFPWNSHNNSAVPFHIQWCVVRRRSFFVLAQIYYTFLGEERLVQRMRSTQSIERLCIWTKLLWTHLQPISWKGVYTFIVVCGNLIYITMYTYEASRQTSSTSYNARVWSDDEGIVS